MSPITEGPQGVASENLTVTDQNGTDRKIVAGQPIPPDLVAEYEEATGESVSGTNATAKAQETADELGVDLSTVEGTGSDGKITVDDVKAAAGE